MITRGTGQGREKLSPAKLENSVGLMGGRKIPIKGGKAKTTQVDLDKKSRIKRENCFVDFLSLGQTFMTL